MEPTFGTMRTTRSLLRLALALAFIVTIFSRCSDKCEVRNEYIYYEPVYKTLAEIRASTGSIEPRPLESPGKIYFKDGYLFVNETGAGIHVIDNRDPESPEPVSFINIPGSYDLAILGNTLFADSYTDLVAFDISNVLQAVEIGRHTNLFQTYGSQGFYVDPVRGVITDWQKVNQVSHYEDDCNIMLQPWGGYREGDAIFMQASSPNSFNKATMLAPGGATTGIAGSMARFAIKEGHLFALDGGSLDVVSIANPAAMVTEKVLALSWDIETVFPLQNNLFIGSRSGMYILDISNPVAPTQVSRYAHMRSCDPVVVEGDYAYVTLRDGNTCEGFVNQLEVINIKDLTAPKLEKMYPMTNPHGLGIDNNVLFVCDGRDGLKIYNSSDIFRISENVLAHYRDIKAFDIIPFNDIAMMIGEDGLYQYDYSDIRDIRLLSHLPIVKPAE